MKFFATGLSGTIGKHLPKDYIDLRVDLSKPYPYFSSLDWFPKSQIVHLGGIVGLQKCEKDAISSWKVNVEGTENLARVFKKHCDGKFIFLSSGHVYANACTPHLETDPLNPSSLYATQKLAAENSLLEIFSDQLDRLLILRVFSVLDWYTAPGSLGALLTEALENTRKISIVNSDDVRDFMTPHTIASNVDRVTKSSKLSGIYNLCTGIGTSVRDAVSTMFRGHGVDLEPDSFLSGNSDLPCLIGDNSRIKKAIKKMDLSWSPTRLSC